MKWSPEPPNIGPREGFDKTDIFGFRPFGEHLATFIGTVEDDPVLLLDGPWGSGKTTFVTQWEGLLRQRGHAVLHLDAFLADHYDDPFLPLTEGVYRVATEEGLCDNAKLLDQFQVFATTVATELFWGVLGLAHPALGSFLGAVKAGIAASREGTGMFQGWLEGAAKRRRAIQDFRVSLKTLARECARQASVKAKGHRSPFPDEAGEAAGVTRFVFVVDELDRCRPRFAIAMLERIKHVFGVKGVTFVLVANVEELSKSVEREYGRIDSKRYLEKFYDLRVRMPEKTARNDSWTGKLYVDHLVDKHDLLPGDEKARGDLREVLGGIAASRSLSLRSVEHIFRNALVLAAGSKQYLPNYPKFVGVVSAVRVLEPSLFRKLVDQRTCCAEEKRILTEMLDPTGRREEEAKNQVDGNLEKHAALPVLARALDGFVLELSRGTSPEGEIGRLPAED